MQYYATLHKTFRYKTIQLLQDSDSLLYIGDCTFVRDYVSDSTVVFDSSREDRYVPWNPIKGNPSVLADTFLDTWYQGDASAGSSYYLSLEHLYLTASFSVLQANGLNLLHMPYFLKVPSYRARLLDAVDDPLVKDFWSRDIDFKDVSSIYSKVYSLLLNPSIRRVFSSRLDRLDAGTVLVDLDLPRTEAKLLGSLMLSQFDGCIVVEDCAKYSSQVLINRIESGQPCLLSYQYREQLDPALFDAIVGKCRNIDAWVLPEPEPIDQADFWANHDRLYTRSSRSAENDIKQLLTEM